MNNYYITIRQQDNAEKLRNFFALLNELENVLIYSNKEIRD